MAPEVLTSNKYNPLVSDVWSMGVVLFLLLQNRFPFHDHDYKALRKSQLAREYKISKSLSAPCKKILEAHLNPNQSTRIIMNEVLQHEWFGPDKASILADDS